MGGPRQVTFVGLGCFVAPVYSPRVALVATFVTCPTRLSSPISPVRPVRRRLRLRSTTRLTGRRESTRSTSTNKETDVNTSVSLMVMLALEAAAAMRIQGMGMEKGICLARCWPAVPADSCVALYIVDICLLHLLHKNLCVSGERNRKAATATLPEPFISSRSLSQSIHHCTNVCQPSLLPSLRDWRKHPCPHVALCINSTQEEESITRKFLNQKYRSFTRKMPDCNRSTVLIRTLVCLNY